MSHIFESIWQTLDPFKQGPNSLIDKKVNHGPHIMPQMARVTEYFPDEHKANVIVVGGGHNIPVKMKIQTGYQGSQPGTGEAIALFPGQLVKVVLGPEGIYTGGVIIHALYTQVDRPSPNHPMWKQAKSKGVKITVNEGPHIEGNTEILDSDSNKYTVMAGDHHIESLGSVSNVQAGQHMTYVEKKTKDLATTISSIADSQKS